MDAWEESFPTGVENSAMHSVTNSSVLNIVSLHPIILKLMVNIFHISSFSHFRIVQYFFMSINLYIVKIQNSLLPHFRFYREIQQHCDQLPQSFNLSAERLSRLSSVHCHGLQSWCSCIYWKESLRSYVQSQDTHWTKHTVRKTGKGLLKAVKEDVTPVEPVASTSMGWGGGRGKPTPKVISGRIDRREQLIPVRSVTMEK